MTPTLSVSVTLSTLPTLTVSNDYRLSTLKRLSNDSQTTIDYEIENRPHAPGPPGGVMGGLFVRIFDRDSAFNNLFYSNLPNLALNRAYF